MRGVESRVMRPYMVIIEANLERLRGARLEHLCTVRLLAYQ